jgi:hypothetical protein
MDGWKVTFRLSPLHKKKNDVYLKGSCRGGWPVMPAANNKLAPTHPSARCCGTFTDTPHQIDTSIRSKGLFLRDGCLYKRTRSVVEHGLDPLCFFRAGKDWKGPTKMKQPIPSGRSGLSAISKKKKIKMMRMQSDLYSDRRSHKSKE